MTDERFAALFYELCAAQGFCSLGEEGEASVEALWPANAEVLARAVFAAEGLDYDTYGSARVKAGVVACITRHLGDAP